MGARPWWETHHPRRRLGALHRPFPARRFGLCFPLGEEEMRVKLRNSLGGGGTLVSSLQPEWDCRSGTSAFPRRRPGRPSSQKR